mgnify:CR=1 FL=1
MGRSRRNGRLIYSCDRRTPAGRALKGRQTKTNPASSVARTPPATINAAAPAAIAREIGAEMGLDCTTAAPSMASEDFAFMLQKAEGAYLWLGAGRAGENPGLHSAKFDFNDAILPQGAEFWVRLAARIAG